MNKYRVYIFRELWLTADEIYDRLAHYQAVYDKHKDAEFMPQVQMKRVARVNIQALRAAINVNNLPIQEKLL